MAFNLKKASDVLIGTGILYVNGIDVGLLKGEVTFSYEPEWTKITGGSPEQTIKEVLTSENATITANMMEVNLSTLASVNALFTESAVSSGEEEVVKEFLEAGLRSGFWTAAQNRGWTEDGTVEVFLASGLTTPASAGATKIYVDDASLFTAADEIILTDGATTETRTIAALGVDESENSLTVTVALSNSYSISGVVHNNTVSMVEGTDYFVNRIDGQLTRIADSAKVADNDPVSVSYEYSVITGKKVTFGGKTTVPSYPIEFISDEKSDGKQIKIRFYKAQFNGSFSLPFNPTDAAQVPVSIVALADSTRSTGDQLGYMLEE
ncbi:MAG: hypothetical protein M0P69_18115 [Bacteroidales bacterium]|nr:hypothetical protein [Bacteroidales bacterium]